MSKKLKIVYFYPHPSTFILRDLDILKKSYDVIPYEFSVKQKWLVPMEFIKQLFFISRHLLRSHVFVCHFAGYSSFLPALIGKLVKIPCLIIVAGNDASKFPDFKYGNFTKKLLGYFTGKSLQLAAHILPVHESLVYQDYTYYDGGKPSQGYTVFAPRTKKIPFTTVYYGYDGNFFKIDSNTARTPNSFISIGNFNDKYVFKRKGYDLIIELANIRPDLNFTLVGWDKKKKINTPKNVTLLPFMSLDKVVETLNKHEFYLQLSIMEGFPNALAEAMLCGCIPIGSNVSGIPDIIGETGYILPERSLNKLNALVEVALKDNKRNQLSQLARERVLANFTYSTRLLKISSVIKKVMK